MSGFRFQDPLWLLLAVPVVLAGIWAIRRARRRAVLYSDVGRLHGLPRTPALRIKRFLPWLRLAGLLLVVAALARPQRGRAEFRLQTQGIAIQMCIDRSGSMQAMDFALDGRPADRLAVVKKVFRDFVAGTGPLPGRPNDLIGLIDFGGFVEAKCPLTLDHGALLQILDTVVIPQAIRGPHGEVVNASLLEEDLSTALGDAVVTAVDRLKAVKAKSKVIVLLSDGKQTAGVVEPAEAARVAKTFGIKIYSIGVGTTGMAPFRMEDDFGRTVYQRQPVELDEEALRLLANETGGRYFNAQDTDTLEKVYATIDRLEKSTSEGSLYTEYRELYQYAVVPGLALVLLEILLVCTRFRSLP